MYRKTRDMAISLFFFAGLLLPTIMYVLGFEAREFEERRLKPFPQIEQSVWASRSFYQELFAALGDRNPLREQAVKLNARVNFQLFGEVDSHQVMLGRGGWLFFYQTVTGDCVSSDELKAQVENLSLLEQKFEQANKAFLWAVAPDKAAIFPDKLTPALLELSACKVQNRGLLRDELAASLLAYFDGWQAVSKLREEGVEPLFFKDETHWSQFATIPFIRSLLEIAKFDVDDLSTSTTGQDVILADLGRMAALYSRRATPIVTFERAAYISHDREAVPHEPPGRPYVISVSNSTEVELSTKRLLLIHDSYTYVAWDQIAQLFKHVRFVHWDSLTPERLAEFSQDADIVVFQTVEREAYDRLRQHFSAPDFANEIAQKLQSSDIAK